MSKINADYKQLNNEAKKFESKLYDAGGIVEQANKLRIEMDTLSKLWVDKEHYSHLNAINKEYETLKEYVSLLDTFRMLLTDASTEYQNAKNESTNIAKSM